ncbi:MAG: ubiquinone/menaquinone biosynthesis methyltransferase [Acidobacteriota bacterium]|nr:ubiquinone/menaquinone biosynthesis methyltransferase [Acidobacteriota bacterium]
MPALHGGQVDSTPAAPIRAMFDRLAGVYDLMNTVMSAGLHRRWRARAADLARLTPGDRVLDVATGTGDLAFELARRVGPGGEVIGCDFAEAMLSRARAKADAIGDEGPGRPGPVRFEWADALDLPYADGDFDAVTVGFGVRNFTDVPRGLRELARVVRPGGRVVVLEITTPTKPPLSLFYRLWFDRVVPAIGLLTGSGDAYAYLPRSVQGFLSPAALAGAMGDAGLTDISYLITAGSIIAIHAGTVS